MMSVHRRRRKPEETAASWCEGLPERIDDNSTLRDENTVDDVVGEIGLVLVVILGGVFAINLVLVALHIQ
jgi:hypothetical protein